MQRIAQLRAGRTINEPPLIELITGRLRRTSELPTLIPDFHPRVVAALVGPQGRAHKAGWHTHSAAGINQQDRQTRTRSEATLERLKGTLIGLLALRRVLDAGLGPQRLVESHRSLAWRARPFHHRPAQLAQAHTPRITLFVDIRVRQDRVEEELAINRAAPRSRVPRTVRLHAVLNQVLRAKRTQVFRRHVGNQPLLRGAHLGRYASDSSLQLRAIRTSLVERNHVVRPLLSLSPR